MTTAIRISGAGLTGALRLTWIRDNLTHVIDHANADEPTGTWIGSACADFGLAIGSDVDIGVLRNLCRDGEIADLIWEAPADLVSEHNKAHQAALQTYEAGNIEVAEHEWSKAQALLVTGVVSQLRGDRLYAGSRSDQALGGKASALVGRIV